MGDDPKRIILARRARFVAAALGGIAMACSTENGSPQPCLSVAADAGPETGTPQPCLSVAVPTDAGHDASDAGHDASDASDAGDAG